jgi:hypothetical protein
MTTINIDEQAFSRSIEDILAEQESQILGGAEGMLPADITKIKVSTRPMTINTETSNWHKCHICMTDYRTSKGRETCEKKCLAKQKRDAEPYDCINCQFCKQDFKYKAGSGDQVENIKRHMIKCERESKIAEEKQKAKLAKKMAEIKAMIMDIPAENRNELIMFIQQSNTTN